ncbi:MAG: metallophosphoesterase [Eubacterium sp.]|nr:metallophosphoesterase [Eubacterium sp.]
MNLRLFAFLTGLLLIVGQIGFLSPVKIYADDSEPVGQFIAFTSDVHNRPGNESAERLGSWIDTMKAAYNICYMGFCGDMADSDVSESEYWDLTQSVINIVSGKGFPVCYTTGNHEFNPGKFSSTSSPAKNYFSVDSIVDNLPSDADFQIYALGAVNDSQSWQGITSTQINKLETFLNNAGAEKPIIILSHFPLHSIDNNGYDRRLTANASSVINILNTASENGKTIIFLWGHNHTKADSSEHNYDKIIGPDSDLQYSYDSSKKKTIKFYYAAAGCMSDTDYSAGSHAVKGKGLVIQIRPDHTMGFGYFDANGNDVTDGGSTIDINYVAPSVHAHPLVKTDAHPATCTIAGNTAYWSCDECKKYFSDKNGENEILKDSWIIAATGHQYGSWTSLNDSQHQRVCSADPSHIEKQDHVWNDGVVTTQPTADTDGVKTYTCTICNAEKTEKIDATGGGDTPSGGGGGTPSGGGGGGIPSGGGGGMFPVEEDLCEDDDHDWDFDHISWEWSDDYSSAKAILICKRNPEHKKEIQASVADETSDGETTYTAVITGPDGKQYKKTVTTVHVHSLTHFEAKEAACTEAGNSEYWACSGCGGFYADKEGETSIEKNSWIVPAAGHDPGEYKLAGKANMERSGKLITVCDKCGKEMGSISVSPVIAKARVNSSTKATISWSAVNGAQRYQVYFSDYSKKTIKYAGRTTRSKYVKKGLKKGRCYRFKVLAQRKIEGKWETISYGYIGHFVSGDLTKDKKYTNPKSITVSRPELSVAVGGTARVKPSMKLVKKGKKLLKKGHSQKYRYLSDNTEVAVVNSSGKITGVGIGTCKVYVIGVNGVSKAVKVTVI